MRVTRAAEDPSIAFSPRPNFPRPRCNNNTRAVREMAKPARRLNLVALPTTGRPSGAMTPRVASTRIATPTTLPVYDQDTIGVDAKQYAGTYVPALRLESLSEKLGYPVRPSATLPVGAFASRPYVAPKRSESERGKRDEEAQLWHLKRAMASLRCFELQWGLVRAELEAAMVEQKKGVKVESVGDAMAALKLQKHLKDLNESKVVIVAQARSAKSGEAMGGLLHDLHENRVAFIERVSQLKASVTWVLEAMQGMKIGLGQSPKNTKKLTQYMQQALDILNTMETMVSEDGFAKSVKKSDLLDALGGSLGRFGPKANGPEEEKVLSKKGGQSSVRLGSGLGKSK